MTSVYKKYHVRELRELVHAKAPTPVNLIMDQGTVDYLLGLNTNNRRLRPDYVETLICSINTIGWKTTETLCVTEDGQLGNGQHRLTALKRLGYPDGICATVVFGADKDSVLVIDQHCKRTASASLKMSVGDLPSRRFELPLDVIKRRAVAALPARTCYQKSIAIVFSIRKYFRFDMWPQ